MNETTVTFAELTKSGVISVTDGYRAKNSELGGDGIIFLRAGHVTDAHIDFAGVERFHEKLTPKLQDKTSRVGDVIVTTKGNSTGRTSFVDGTMPTFVYSPHLSRWRVEDRTKIDPAFLRYWSRCPQFVNQMRGLSASTDMAPYLSLRDQQRLEITLPHIDEQRGIGDVLCALDDKIEQNRRTGSKLEGLARGVFKAWFVDFEPVKAKAAGATTFPGMPPETFAALPTRFTNSELGPAPQGWEVRSLYSAATFINGAAFKSSHFCDASSGIPVVKIAELKGGITEQTKHSSRTDLDSRYRIDTGEILYSWSGSPDTSLDTFLWTKGPGLLNQHIFRVVTESEAQKVFVYHLLKHLKQDLIEIARNKQTTGLGHVTVGDMQRLLVAWPDPKTLNGFREVIGPVFAAAFNGLLESEKLAALRDYLLPRLLSGRVRVEAVRD